VLLLKRMGGTTFFRRFKRQKRLPSFSWSFKVKSPSCSFSRRMFTMIMHRICSFFLILGLPQQQQQQQQQLNKLIVESDSKGNTAPSNSRRKSKSQDATPNPNPLDLPEVQDSLRHISNLISQNGPLLIPCLSFPAPDVIKGRNDSRYMAALESRPKVTVEKLKAGEWNF